MNMIAETVGFVLGWEPSPWEEHHDKKEEVFTGLLVPEEEFRKQVEVLAGNAGLFAGKGVCREIEWTALRVAHASMVIRLSPRFEKLRFALCPAAMCENSFWTTYFILCSPILSPALHIAAPSIDIADAPIDPLCISAEWSFCSDSSEACEVRCPHCSHLNADGSFSCAVCASVL